MSRSKALKAMPASTDKARRLVGWNGLQLQIPADWDARVAGQRHLVFEKDFQPQLQIKWEHSVQQHPGYLQKKVSQIAGNGGTTIPEEELPGQFQQFSDNFAPVTCYRQGSETVKGGIFLCHDCYTLVLFQLLSDAPTLVHEAGDCLTSIICHHNSERLWRIQDFSLTLPVSYSLKDYTFGAGLTRLSFCSSHLLLQTCTLGPADTRLSRQSLVEILTTLIATSDLELIFKKDDNSCEGHRSPTILKQIFLRLRREKPFIRTKIWHDATNNRLLAVVLSSNIPISPSTIHKICSKYEIFQKESRV